MKKTLCSLIWVLTYTMYSQVGINTTAPNAQLDITSSNQATPSNTDGIIIPKVDAFPVTNPTALQIGMMVFLTTVSGSNQPGFYYWDNATTSWIGITSTKNADADFYEVGSTNAPDNINDAMFHTGNVKIGTSTNLNGKLDIVSDNTKEHGISHRRDFLPLEVGSHVGFYNYNTGTASSTISGNTNYILTNGNGQHYGTENYLIGSGIGSRIGYNSALIGNGTGTRVGIITTIANSAGNGNHFGSRVTNTSIGNGNHYGNYVLLAATGNGSQVANESIIATSGDGTHVGTRSELLGVGNGEHYGNKVILSGIGGNKQTGTDILIDNSGDGIHYGSYVQLSDIGNGNQAGNETVIDNGGAGWHYGQINSLTGAGVGTKFGSYNYIDALAGGLNFGVYSNATNPLGYAGFFLGNVLVSGVFTNPSDASLKENIAPTSTILDKINSIQVKDYTFKADLSQKYGFARGQQTGFIAQEMEQLFPNLVKEETLSTPNDPNKIAETTHEERKIKSINYVGLIPYLTKAIQEQQHIIATEKEKSARLEAELNSLKQSQLQLETRLKRLEDR